MDPTSRAFRWLGVGAILVGVLVFWQANRARRLEEDQYRLHLSGHEPPVSVPQSERPSAYTHAQFGQITTGMWHSRVIEILGGEGTVASETSWPGVRIVAVQWNNSDGSGLQITFENDRVVGKAQFGLR